MPPPLSDGQVTYADGTEATVAQMAAGRRRVPDLGGASRSSRSASGPGLKVMLFLIVLTGLTFATKRKVWAHLH